MTGTLCTRGLLALVCFSLSGTSAVFGQAATQPAPGTSNAAAQGHMANIQRLTREGVMVVAGPFEGQSGDRAMAGIFILRVASMEEATAVAESDPAVKAGRFVYEIAPWWGPSSLRY